MVPEARSKFGAPMFETEVVVKKMYCIEESTCDIFGLFGAPMVTRSQGNCDPLAPLVTPLHMAISHCCQARNQGGDRRRNPLKY